METGNKISEKTLLIAVLTIIISEFVLVTLAGYLPLKNIPKVGLIRLIQLVGLIGIVTFFNNGVSAIGISKDTVFKGFKKGVLWAAAFGCLAGASFLLLFLAGINPFDLFNQTIEGGVLDIIVFFIVGGIIGPVVEEVFFRGVIYGFFRQWGVAFGIIASTVFFAVLHVKGGGIPYIQMAGGLVFAVSYEIEKSLFVPVVIHVTGNIALFTISLV